MNFKPVGLLVTFVVALFCLFPSCSTPPVQTWNSSPPERIITQPVFEARLAPIKEKDPFFVGFRLTIHNKSQSAILVDWNTTRYLHNGKDMGPLIFVGIDPGSIQGKIPPDTIAAGETFAKEIFPLRTIAFLPPSQLPAQGRRGFMPGILPAGDNTVVLSLKQNDQLFQPDLSLRLKAEPSQPQSK